VGDELALDAWRTVLDATESLIARKRPAAR
jgi:hypothetical protein